MKRGSGSTTKQIKNAPLGAIYVWLNNDLHYPRRIAEEQKRTDIKFVGPNWLDKQGFRGLSLSGLILDHATHLTDEQWQYYIEAKLRVGR